MRKSLAVIIYIIGLSVAAAFAQTLQSSAVETANTNQVNRAEWTADDIVMAEQASSAQISPDCRWVVWIKSVPNQDKDKSISNLVLSSLTEKKEIQLTRGTDGVSDPKWSPDNRFVAFTTSRAADQAEKDAADSQLWLINPFGGEPWKLTDFVREISDYVWADNDTIIFSAKENPTFYDQSTQKDDAKVIEDEAHASPIRLYKFSVKSKEVTRLTHNTDRIDSFYLSPDGNHAVTIHGQSLSYSYDNKDKPFVFLYDLKTGERQQIFNETRFNIDEVVWAQDGKGFYAVNDFKENPRYLWAVLHEIYYYDLATGKPVKVNLDWENGLTGSFVATNDGFIALLANGVRNKVARYTRAGNSWRREFLMGEHAGNIFGIKLGADNKTLLYNYSTASTPSQWYSGELIGSQITAPKQITNINQNLQKKQIARTEIIKWKGALNEDVEGILYYPHNYKPGQKYPLVLMIHGGPTLVDSDAWKETYHYPHNLYASRGAFVFAPNYHGSSNYGLKWAESIGGGNYYELEVPDIEKGVDWLIAKGLVDPEKLGTLGWSNGSLLTIALTTRTNRYKAAGAGAGVVDWTSDWANAYFGASFNNYYFGKSPLEDPERYVRKSPFYQLEKVRTPTIIFFGEKDTTVAPSQGWMHFRALQQLGKTDVKFVMFPGESHSFRKLSHQKRKIEEEMAWFNKYLFKTGEETNEALKPDSPLAIALKQKNIKRNENLYGQIVSGKLVPETVNYENLNIGRFEVTRAQYAQFDSNYKIAPGTENYPANNITFDQAQKYCVWLGRLANANYRLANQTEAKTLYDNQGANENTLDYWAGYPVNPEDAARLKTTINKLGNSAPLLKEVGSFKGDGTDELVYDLGGNVAEWINVEGNQPKAFGGSADLPVDTKIRNRQPAAEYVGFRVIKDSGAAASVK
ncbi:MAG: prolyl oligopeptidase family serine peptidase [Pyrinomonadaceae bacterium]